MYISEININNYKNYSNTNVVFHEGLNVIVGPNNVGKTNLLCIIEFLHKKPVSDVNDFNKFDLHKNWNNYKDNPPEIKIVYTIDHEFSYDEEDSALSRLQKIIIFDNEATLLPDINNHFHIKAKVLLKFYLNPILLNDYQQHMQNVANYQEFFDVLMIYNDDFVWNYFNTITDSIIIKDEINDIFEINSIPAYRDIKDLSIKSGGYVAKIIKNENQLNEREIQQKITKLMQSKLSKVIDKVDKEIDKDQDKIGITDGKNNFKSSFLFDDPLQKYFKYELMNSLEQFELPLDNNGLGYNNLIYIRNLIKQNKDDDYNILLIEEPEAHLHPNMQYKLLNYLDSLQVTKGSNKKVQLKNQIIITTHSPNISATVDINKIIMLSTDINSSPVRCNVVASELSNSFDIGKVETLIDWDKCCPIEKQDTRKNKFANLLSASKNHLKKFLDITRSDILFSKKIVLVEGISEKMFILGTFKELMNSHVSVVEVGGINFNYFLPIALFSNKQILCITDKDCEFYDEKNKKLRNPKIYIEKDSTHIREEFLGLSNVKVCTQSKFGSTFEKELFIENFDNIDHFTFLLRLVLPNAYAKLIKAKTHSFEYWYNNKTEIKNKAVYDKFNELIDKYKDSYDNSNEQDKILIEKMFFTNLFYSYVKNNKGDFILKLLASNKLNKIICPTYIKEGIEWIKD